MLICYLQRFWPSWMCGFLFMMYRKWILRTLLSGWSFLFMVYANHGAIAFIAGMTLTHPLLSRDDDDNHWSWHQHLLNDIILSGPGPSLHRLVPFLTWWLSNPVPLIWPTITRQIQDHIAYTQAYSVKVAMHFMHSIKPTNSKKGISYSTLQNIEKSEETRGNASLDSVPSHH